MKLYENEQDFFNKFSMIVSASENDVIGKNNNLPWHFPNDLKRFKSLTTNKIIIMGKNTYLSLPKKQPLANRINVVISSDNDFLNKNEIIYNSHTGIIKLKNIFEVFNFIYDFELKKSNNHEISSLFDIDEYFIIGGQSIYELFLPYIKKIYLTKIHAEINGDCYLPDLTKYIWKITEKIEMKADIQHLYDYTYFIFEKINTIL